MSYFYSSCCCCCFVVVVVAVVVTVVVVVVLLLLLLFLPFVGMIIFKKAQGSVVSNQIGNWQDCSQVNMHRLTESDF